MIYTDKKLELYESEFNMQNCYRERKYARMNFEKVQKIRRKIISARKKMQELVDLQ